MITHIISTMVLALTFGALWHNQGARRQNEKGGNQPFPLGRLVNRALEWLVLMPHLSNPAESKSTVVGSQQSVMPQGFRPVLRDVQACNAQRRILVEHAPAAPSVPVGLFKIEGEHA